MKTVTALTVSIFLAAMGVFAGHTYALDTEVTAGVDIDNASPSVEMIAFSTTQYGSDNLTSSGILPSVGTDRVVYVTGVVSDPNGETELATTSLTFNRSTLTSSCTSDKNDCYHVSVCDMNTAYGTGTEAAFSCTLSLAYWIDATDASGRYSDTNWVATVTASDTAAQTGVATSSIEVNSLLALNIPETINYGTRALGEQSTTASNVETVLTQKGNAALDVEVYGTAMGCSDTGTIPVGNQRWSLLDVGYVATSSNTLSGTSVATDRNILFRENDGVELVESLYWNIAVPATSVAGTCSGSNTISIVAYPGDDGFFIDGRLANVAYSSNYVTGRTGSNGSFRYYPNDTLTLSIGAVTLGSIDTDTIPGDSKLTLADLLGLSPRANLTDSKLLSIARFLQALDSDPSSTSTITIPETAHTALASSIDFATVSDGALTTQLQTVYATGTLPSVAQAQAHLASTYASENITTYNAPTLTLNSSASSIPITTAVTLSWTSTDANTCTASGGWSGSQATTSAGVSSGNLTTQTTFTLTCNGYGGATSSSVTVVIAASAAATTSTFSTGPSSFALKTNGTLWAWGDNTNGGTGLGTTTGTTLPPAQVGSDTDWAQVFAGNNATFALKTNGTLWAWGDNASGQMGDGSTTSPRTSPGQVGASTAWIQASAGSSYTLARKTDGTLWAWGVNTNGELGLGATSSTPVVVPNQIGTDTDWAFVSAGEASFGIKTDGTLWAWGRNALGNLGLGDTTNRVSPTQVGTSTLWVDVESGFGGTFTLARRSDGTLWAWGRANVNQLGIGTTATQLAPVQIGTSTNWTAVSAGFFAGFAMKTDGTLWSWGLNQNGQTGLGVSAGNTALPTQVGSATTWVRVDAGNRVVLARRSDGALWGWGSATINGTTTNQLTPVQLLDLGTIAMTNSDTEFAVATPGLLSGYEAQAAAVSDALEPMDDSFLEHLRSWVVTALVYMLYN